MRLPRKDGSAPLGQRSPSVELVSAHRAGEERHALVAQLLTVETDFDPSRLGHHAGRRKSDPHALSPPGLTTCEVDVAAQPVERSLQLENRVEAPLVSRGDAPGAARVDLSGPGHAVHGAPHPDIADRRFFREEVALADDQVRDLAFLDGAVRARYPEPIRGRRGERREGVVGRETARHGNAQVGKEVVERRQPVRGDGEPHPGVGELRRARGGEIPTAQIRERRVQRGLRIADLRSVREVQRHDQRLAPALEHVDDPVLLAVPPEPRLDPELRRETVRAEVFLLAAGLEDDRLIAVRRVFERRQGFARFRREEGAAARLIRIPGAHVPVGVHERLFHQRYRAHRGVRIRSAQLEGALEADRLGDVGSQHPLAHTRVAEIHQRGRSPEDPLLGNHQRRAKPLRTERRAPVGVVLKIPRGGKPCPDLRIPVRGADVPALRHRVHPEIGVCVDEARVHCLPVEIPHPRASRCVHVSPDRLDEAVADHDRGVVHGLPRPGHDPRPHQGVVSGAIVAHALDRLGPGRLLRPGTRCQDGREPHRAEYRFHRTPLIVVLA